MIGMDLLSLQTGPMVVLLVFCAVTALVAMVCVAWHDVLTFEIEFTKLGEATLAMSCVIGATGGPADLADAAATGLITGGTTWIVVLWTPGRIGWGDIWLMAFLGFAAGPDHAAPVLATFCLFCGLTSAAYSRARGKRLFKSMFPMALPGMGAAMLALALRLGDAGDRIDVAQATNVELLASLIAVFIAGRVAFTTWRTRIMEQVSNRKTHRKGP